MCQQRVICERNTFFLPKVCTASAMVGDVECDLIAEPGDDFSVVHFVTGDLDCDRRALEKRSCN